MQKKRILVVGGAGYIGSHVNKMLHQAGYDTLILDNLSQGHLDAVRYGKLIQGDLADRVLLDKIFTDYSIDAVMHFAAVTDVGESVHSPLKYYQNNVSNTLNLLEAMLDHSVETFIFSSSAALFGIPREPSLTVNHPQAPINPYGHSKMMVETILKDLEHTTDLKFCCLRYFNAAGGDPEEEIKNYQTKSTNLIPIVLRSVQNNTPVTIFGTDYPTFDGTCVRDYVHVWDLAMAHLLAMEQMFDGARSSYYNLGNGQGYSVREVIAAVEYVTGQHVDVIEGDRRPGDPASLVACSEKARRELGWEPQYPELETMISHAWKACNDIPVKKQVEDKK